MLITSLKFNQVLDKFYEQSKYDFLLLFVSSFDSCDRDIIQNVIENANRIDRITGDRICFFYFVKDSYDSMNEKLVRWIKDIPDEESLYGVGVNVTMGTADDICSHFKILRSSLPALILVCKDKQIEHQVLTIQDYQDFEEFLTSLNIFHSYLEDRKTILTKYKSEPRREVFTQEDVDENIVYSSEDLFYIRESAVRKLNMVLNIHCCDQIFELLEYDYVNAVLKLWEYVNTIKVRISSIIRKIRQEIYERGFDVFISCKREDYKLAHELYDLLLSNGYRPFLADTSIKEVGIDQYTALIGEVINVCSNMIVFATDVNYLETSYVAAEWHAFINDINTGKKSNAKLINILSSNIDIHSIPTWLRDKQCFTIDNYKQELIDFLSGIDEERNRLNEYIKKLIFDFKRNNNSLQYYRNDRFEYEIIKFIERLNDLERDIERAESAGKLGYIWSEIEELEEQINDFESEVKHFYEEYNNLITYIYGLQNRLESISIYLLKGCDENRIKNGIAKCIDYLQYVEYKIKRVESVNELEEFRRQIDELESQIYHFEREIKSSNKVNSECYSIGNHKNKIRFCIKAPERTSNYRFEFGPSKMCQRIESKSSCQDCSASKRNERAETFNPKLDTSVKQEDKKSSFWQRLFGKKCLTEDIKSSVFAPAEVKKNSFLMVQVYLHSPEDNDKIKSLAEESDKNAIRRDYVSLSMKLKKNDKVDIKLRINGEKPLFCECRSVIWQGLFTKCSFDYFVPEEIKIDELMCVVELTVNGAFLGEMKFITRIVETPRNLNSEIFSHRFKKIFISYAHNDAPKTKFLALAYKAQGVDYFYDRDKLGIGDIYKDIIFDYIDKSDLFVLCWSKNAAASDYVAIEKERALKKAYPQCSLRDATLKICPISIEPHADLPEDMKDIYNFEEV